MFVATYFFVFFQKIQYYKMGRGEDGIRREDCPVDRAPFYPGKKSRNNPNGSTLTKFEFVSKTIEDWVKHFDDSDKYHNTGFAEKVGYLKVHLRNLFVGSNEVKETLLAVENKLAENREEENLANSQNFLNTEMDVDNDDGSEPDDPDIMISRWEREQEIEKLLQLTDEEIFESGVQISEHLTQSKKYKQREKSFFLPSQTRSYSSLTISCLHTLKVLMNSKKGTIDMLKLTWRITFPRAVLRTYFCSCPKPLYQCKAQMLLRKGLVTYPFRKEVKG